MSVVRPKKVEPFESLKISPCGLITIVGKSNSGKTTLLRSVINKLYAEGLFRVYVFSSTADLYRDSDYNFTAPQYVHKISMERIRRLKLRQEIIVKRSVKDKRLQPRWICIVLDDFIGDNDSNLAAKKSAVISQLAVSGRHYKICTILLSQHLNKCPPVVRLQSNYIFVTKTNMTTIKDGLFPLQTQYTNKSQFWELYNSHSQSKKYSSMMFQDVDPYDDNIRWLEPVKMVDFIDDPASAKIIQEVEEHNRNKEEYVLQELEDDKADDSHSSNDEGGFGDDSSSTG